MPIETTDHLHTQLSSEEHEQLERLGFLRVPFAELRQKLLRTGPEAFNASAGQLAVLPQDSIGSLDDESALRELGQERIAKGTVGAVILAGGMATRFGGVVKAAVDVLDGRSFLELKLSEIEATAAGAGGRVPVFIMASFATEARLRELVSGLAPRFPRLELSVFTQFVSLRIAPDGSLFRDQAGQLSWHAPGHGDLIPALRAQGGLARFVAQGGKHLLMSNVDNLGATLDPAVIGWHVAKGLPLTVELVRKHPGDRGGAPVIVGQKEQILEAFRFPADFDQDAIPVFNTNTFVFDAAAVDREFAWTWFVAEKQVQGRPVLQFERLVGELSAFLPCAWLEVPREGNRSRFVPVKKPDDLERIRPLVRQILSA